MARTIGLSCFFLVLQILAGCGQETDVNASSGQVVAKVNNEEISVHQLNFVLSRFSNPIENNVKRSQQFALDSLINQSLMVQQANAENLDHDPDVMMAVHQAKRQVLAQAWIERNSQITLPPSDQEIETYYYEHPALFSKRKIYKLKELLLNRVEARQAHIKQLIDASTQINDLIARLEKKKIAFQLNETTQAAEKLPLENLVALQSLQHGQFIHVDRDSELLIIAVVDTIDDPIGKEKARDLISAVLVEEKRNASIDRKLRLLKEQAKIEYIGEFSKALRIPSETNQLTEAGRAQDDITNKGNGI